MRVVAIAALAALVPSLALAADVAPGRYTGTTKHGVSTRLRVTGDGHVKYRLGFHWSCNTANRHSRGSTTPVQPPKLRSDGTFRYRDTGSSTNNGGRYSFRERIWGKVSRSRARGAYSAVLHYDSGRTCKVRRLGWSARRR